jgi:hypothetical protein
MKLYIRKLSSFSLNDRSVDDPGRQFVLSYAAYCTGLTSNAFPKIDHHYPSTLFDRF